ASVVQSLGQPTAPRRGNYPLAMFNNTGVVGAATRLYRLSLEKAKPDAEREPGFQQRDLPTIEGAMKQLERRYVPAMYRQLQAYWLNEYIKLPAAQRVPAVDQWLGGNDAVAVERALDR